MINFDFNKKCYGCAACKNICPKKAITMNYDKDGFLVPYIDKDKCIDCNLCEKVCPRISFNLISDTKKNLRCMYIFKKNVKDISNKSTSSGICYDIAKYAISNGSYVCGCIYDNMYAKHILTNKIEDLDRICGTKYVQSDIQDVYHDIKKHLNAGEKIVFFGMACQIIGLRKFLKKDYNNMCYIQIICHSVPSPKVFEKYKDSVENKYNKKLININFRHKGKGGWLTPNTLYYFDDNSKVSIVSDAYFVGFGQGLFDRNSCSECQLKNNFEIADIILGDAWGIKSSLFIKSKNKGASSVIINSRNGEELFEKVSNLYFVENVSLEEISKENPALIKKCKVNENRNKVLEQILNDNKFNNYQFLGKKHILKNMFAKIGVLSFLKKIRYIIKHR